MRFEKSFKSCSNNQWLWSLEKILFDIIYTLHAIISKLEYYWWRNNNYTKKLVIEMLS
jgi:hypothetical protein